MTIRFPRSVTLVLESGIDSADEHKHRFAAGETVELAGITPDLGVAGYVTLHFPPLPPYSRGWRACAVHESTYDVVSST